MQVAVIRKGATNIRIEQHGFRGQVNDDNYLGKQGKLNI